MVQGWRRYSFKQMAGIEPFDLKYLPEQGIETNGTVVSYNFWGRQVPKSDVDVSLLLLQKGEDDDEDTDGFVETFVTDSQGRFSFTSDVERRWNMILSVKEKEKAKNYQIILDRVFSPELRRRYRYSDMQVSITQKVAVQENSDDDNDEAPGYEPENDYAEFLAAYRDSLAKLGIEERVHLIEEVTVRGRRTRAQKIYESKSTAVAYYDVAAEFDDLYDSGDYSYIIGDNFNQMLLRLNNRFAVTDTFSLFVRNTPEPIISAFRGDILLNIYANDILMYNFKPAFVVINHEPVEILKADDFFIYRLMGLRAIKNIYINEKTEIIANYIIPPPMGSLFGLAMSVGCVVLIEAEELPVEGGKGVRKTWLDGYSVASEFYSPNYSELPPVPDYRRTLYWNPMVTPDENGKAKIQFYNNSRIGNFSISAETVTPLGGVGINKN